MKENKLWNVILIEFVIIAVLIMLSINLAVRIH